MVAMAYGYWGYQTLVQRPQELDALRAEAIGTQRNLEGLRRSVEALPAPEQLPADPLYQPGTLRGSLLAPMDGIRGLDQLTLLAERTGVSLSSIQLATGKREKVGGVDLDVLQVSFTARGNTGDLAGFFRALQEGILPWLEIEQVDTNLSQAEASFTVRASLYTLDGQASRATLPTLLKAGQTPVQALAPAASRPGSSNTPVLAFTVESLFAGMDALRSLRIQVSQPKVLSMVKLYAETSGGDTLVAEAVSGSEILLLPKSPFSFQGRKEQRFYLTADVRSLTDLKALAEVSIPGGGAKFTSGLWPPAESAASFKASLLVRQPPTAQDQQLSANFQGQTPITLQGAAPDGAPLSFILVSPPTHGALTGTFSDLRYVSNAGYLGPDSFTFKVSDGYLESDEVWLSLNVYQRITIDGVPASSREGSTINLASTIRNPGAVAIVSYGWNVARNGVPYATGAAASFSFTPDDDGDYVVSLTVMDNHGGTSSETRTINVTNVAPLVHAPGGATIDEGNTFSRSGSFSGPVVDTWVAQVDYGDGSEVQPLFLNQDKTFSLRHMYTENGVYTLTVIVTDEDGAVGSDTAVINVTNSNPTATINDAPASSPKGSIINLGSTITDPGTADTFSYAWSVVRNGSPYATGAAASFSFTPEDEGTYEVSLTVTDDDGGTSSESKTIDVTAG
jgi:hypothetical protein